MLIMKLFYLLPLVVENLDCYTRGPGKAVTNAEDMSENPPLSQSDLSESDINFKAGFIASAIAPAEMIDNEAWSV